MFARMCKKIRDSGSLLFANEHYSHYSYELVRVRYMWLVTQKLQYCLKASAKNINSDSFKFWT